MTPQGYHPNSPYQPAYRPPPSNGLAGKIVIGGIFLLAIIVLLVKVLMPEQNGHAKVVVHPSQLLEPGVRQYHVDLPGGDGTRTLLVTLPDPPPTHRVPALFIAPAGSTCFLGNALGDGDTAELVPYARDGEIVVAYSLDGDVSNTNSESQVYDGLTAFRNAHAGLDDTRAAVDYALANIPQIDPTHLYAVGHSSAGTMALLAAENDSRFAGCIAYAPVCNIVTRLGESDVALMDRQFDGFRDFLVRYSPQTQAASLRCPTFLFHAEDDAVVPTENVATFAQTVQQTNLHVTFSQVPTGDHYDSMIQQGIPQGIQWLHAQP